MHEMKTEIDLTSSFIDADLEGKVEKIKANEANIKVTPVAVEKPVRPLI